METGRGTHVRRVTRTTFLCRQIRIGQMFLLIGSAFIAGAQNYSIDPHSVPGGGGISADQRFRLAGSIDYGAKGVTTGGRFTLTGGVETLLIAVQTPEAPALFVTHAEPGFATVWWTPSTPGFVLQISSDQNPGSWTNAPSGPTNPVTVPTERRTALYRLIKH